MKNNKPVILERTKRATRFAGALARRVGSLTKRRIAAIIIALILVGGYFLHTGRGSNATWYDDSYAYRKKITIGNSGAAISSARKVLVEVDTAALTTDKMQADCDDTRFTDINGKVLRHFIDTDSGACDTSSTDYYVELTSVTTGDNIIYMYYGNPSAISARKNDFFDNTTLNSALKGYWKMDESAANTCSDGANDSCDSAYIADGAWNGNATSAAGKLSNGVTFDGTGDYINTADPSSGALDFGLTDSFSISAWVKTATKGSGSPVIVMKRAGTEYYTLRMVTASGFPQFAIRDTNSNEPSTVGTTDLSTDTWYHVVGVRNVSSDNLTVYVNGVAEGTPGTDTTNATLANAATLKIGTDTGSGNYWNGTIDDVRVYRKALSTTEIGQIYNSGSGTTIDIPLTFTPTSGPTLASEEKTPGPVAYWKFDDGQGSTAQDTTVNNNDGTLGTGSSAPSWVEESRCVSGKCLQFDGSNDYVDFGNVDDAFITGSAISISAWARPSTNTSAQTLVSKGVSFTTNDAFNFFLWSNGTVFCDIGNGTTNGRANGGSYSANEWQFFTCVYNGTNVLIYRNGIQIASGSQTGNIGVATESLQIGKMDGSTNYFKGFIDEVKIYPYARSAAQVAADFAKGAASKGGGVLGAADTSALSQGLVGYWKMDESAANSCSGGTNDTCDSSGNTNDGAWTNNVASTVGKYGNGTVFDGDGDIVNVGSGASLANLPANGITLSAWIYPTGFSYGVAATYFNKFKTSDTDVLNFRQYCLVACSLDASIDTNGTTAFTRSNEVISLNTWTHVVMTYNDKTDRIIHFYKNGAKVTSISSQTAATGTLTDDSSYAFTLGRSLLNSNWTPYTGKLDEARIYNRVLSADEIRQLYNFAPGPVQHWKMDDGSSSSVKDASGNGNNGALGGTIASNTWSPGKFGTGILFNSTNNYVSNVTDPGVSTKQFTFETWINQRTNRYYNGILGRTSGDNISFLIDGTGTLTLNGGLWFSSGGITCSGMSTNTWVHIALTGDGTNAHLFKNGMECGTSKALDGTLSWPGSVYLGVTLNSYFFDGQYDDFRVYNYARTQKQIIEDMNAGHPVGGSPVGSSVATFHMDDMEGTVAEDSSINGNDLTLSSRSWTASGKVNGAWNGTNAVWLSRADDSDFDVSATEDYSITGWIKSDSATNPSATEYIVNKASSVIAGYAVYFNTSGFLCFGIDDDTTWGPDIASCTSADYYDAGWHHFSAVRDTVADTTRIYVDGLSRDSDSDTTSATLANSLLLYVGDRDGTDNGDEFTGDVDEINIYRSALNADDVKIVMNNNSSVAASVLGATEASTLSDGTGNGPVAEWLMNEGANNTCTGGANDVCDVSGNGVDGALGTGSSAPTWTAGKNGGGLKFDGVDDYASFTYTNFGTSITYETWFNPSSLSGTVSMLNFMHTSVRLSGSTIIRWLPNYDNAATDSTVSLSTNTWHHLAITQTGTTAKIYLNGNLITTNSSAISVNTTAGNERIGGGGPGGASHYPGKLDDTRVYNYVRTPAQIAYDYNRGRPVAHWRLDECQGSTAYGSPLGVAHDSALNGTITIGASGETTVGDCTTSSTAWGDGATGKFNSSLSFDGTDDLVTITDAAVFNWSNLTLSAWVYANDTTESGIISKGLNSGSTLEYGIYINSSGIPSFYIDDNGSWGPVVASVGTSAITTGRWTHLTGTYDGSNLRFYIDGKLVDTDAYSSTVLNSTGSVYIGSFYDTSGSNCGGTACRFNGLIDDVQIFNYALSAAQVRNVYNGGAAVNYGPSTGAP